LPVGMMGFIIAAMLSATMSTLGSEYNTLSGVLTKDFYKRIINPLASEKKEMLFGRFATLIIGVVTMLLAILLNSLKGLTLMDIMYRFFSAFGPPIMIPLIAGLLFRYFNSRGVIWGVICGAVTGAVLVAANVILVQKYSLLMTQDPQVDYWLRSGWNSAATMLNIAMTVLGMFLGTIFYRTPEDEKKRVSLFFEDLKRPFEIGEGGSKEKVSPFGLIGMTLFFLGLAITAVAFVILGYYRDMNAFLINLAIAAFLMALGAVMKWSARGKTA
jgi:solute:Na+ symporter, SSS family